MHTECARVIAFVVLGTPVPQGSMKGFIPKGWNRPILTSDNSKTKPWKQQISGTAAALNVAGFERDIPVCVDIDFYFLRPASAKKRKGMTVKPDKDKLERAVYDALTGILFADDAQVVDGRVRKLYAAQGEPARAEIRITPATWDRTGKKPEMFSESSIERARNEALRQAEEAESAKENEEELHA